MNKKVIALFLCIVLCMTLLPVAAFAGEGPGAAVAGGSPYTGDESNVTLWIVVAAVALAAIIAIVIYLLKRRK